MKKLLALLAVVLCVVSCQTEPEGLDVNVGGEIDAIVNVTIPEVETRAAGSDSALGAIQNGVLGTESDNTTLRYILQVYYKDGENYVQSAERLVEYSDGKSVAFDVRLVPQRNYQFVVWADVVTDGKNDTDNHYITKDANGKSTLDNITLNGEWNAMDESRDAFTASEYIDNYNGSKDITITLKRPFAKLRVVTTDIKNLTNLGIVPHNAVVEYTTNHRVAFNALAGKAADASESKTHTFELAQYTNESNTGAEYTLFTDYFFAENDIVKFDLTVKENGGKVIGEPVAFQTDINVKRNYLTTIKGNILTDGKNFNVTIDDAFAQPEIERPVVEVYDVSELQNAINEAEEGKETTIVIGGDIDLGLGGIILATRAEEPSYGILVSAGKNITLDLAGKTLSMNKECTKSFSMIENRGNLTITGNGKISFKDTGAGDPNFGWGSYTVSNYGGTLVVENGTIEHLGEQNSATEVKHMICAIYQYSGSTTINGGTISTPTYRSARLWKGDMTIKGGNFNGQVWVQAVDNSANLTINGGEFAPCGADGSSIFITNGEYNVQFAVNGGFFNTKIGCTDATKTGVKGSIVGGTFTAEAKSGTNAALLANGYFFEKVGENYSVNRTTEAKVGSIIEINGVKAVIFSLENGMKAVSVEQGGEMLWDESMNWAKNLGEGWSLASLSELQAIHAVRATLNEALAADDQNNALFEEDNKEEDGTYAAYWSSTLVEGSTGSTSKAYYLYFDNDATVVKSFTMFPVEYSRAVYNLGYYNVGDIVECAGQKAVVYSVENGVKAVSVAELNLNGKYWQDAIDWAAGLGNGWSLASMEDLNAIYDLRCELNDALEAENAENALFWEGDELYIKNGSVYYALYMSCDEVPAGEKDANGNEYWENRVFFKKFNKLGYSDVLYSAFDCINKYAPLRDNYFARGVYTLN